MVPKTSMQDIEGQTPVQRRLFTWLFPRPKLDSDAYERGIFERGNLLSRVLFIWVFPILRVGYYKTLSMDDLYELDEGLKVQNYYADFEVEYTKRLAECRLESAGDGVESVGNGVLIAGKRDEIGKEAAELTAKTAGVTAKTAELTTELTAKDHRKLLLLSLLGTFKYQYGYAVMCIILCDVGNSLVPLVTKRLISYVGFKAAGTELGLGKGIGYALGASFSISLCYFFGLQYLYYSVRTGTQAKAILTKLLLTKAFQIGPGVSASKLTTLISTDLAKIDLAFHMAPFLVSFLPSLTVAIVILALNIGVSTAVGVGVIVLFSIMMFVFTKLMINLRISSLVFTDKRVQYVKEVVNNLRIIKLYNWEKPYTENIKSARTSETKRLYRLQYLRNALIAVAVSVAGLSSMASFLVLYGTGGTSDPAKIFSSVSLFGLLGYFITTVPLAVGVVSDGVISMGRVCEVLANTRPGTRPEGFSVGAASIDSGSGSDADTGTDTSSDTDTDSGSVSGTKSGPNPVANPDPNPDPNNAITVNGSFFWPITKSEEPDQSELESDKKPFKLNLNFNIKKGEFIVITGPIGSGKSSLLQALAGFMPSSNSSLITTGTSLLCGQPWIQNTTLKENILFGKPFVAAKYTQAVKTSGLIPDFDTLPAGDNTEVGERGVTLSGGQKARVNLARALYSDPDILFMDDVLSAVDSRVGRHIMDGLLKLNKTRVLATHQLWVLDRADRVITMDGGVAVIGSQLQPYSHQVSHQILKVEDSQHDSNNSHNLGHQILQPPEKEPQDPQDSTEFKENLIQDTLITDETKAVNSIPFRTYVRYLQAGSSPLSVPMFVLIAALILCVSTFTQLFNNVWLSFWIERKFQVSSSVYIGLYVMFTVLALIFNILQFGVYIHLTNHAARALNLKAINQLLGAPMSYLDVTPIGRILNRFTKDTDALDNEIVEQVRMFSFSAANIFGTVILCVIYIPWFAIALPIMGIIFLLAGSFYQASSREIKRLEALERSHVYNNFNECLTGMGVILAYRDETRFIEKNDKCVDNMNRANFLVNAVQKWLGTQLNLISLVFVLVITLLCVFRVFHLGASSVGLLVSYTMGLPNMLVLIVQSYTQLENEMNSVERMCDFAFDIPQEGIDSISSTGTGSGLGTSGSGLEKDSSKLGSSGSRSESKLSGKITFKDVCMRYRPGLPLTLKNISFQVQPGEKIGIVGRTGAGKTSLTSVLYRLNELTSGQILIDDIDISTMTLSDLRSSLSIIPQESVLFGGTIRRNLDPFGVATDQQLKDVLVKSGLVKTSSESGKFDLDSTVQDDGANYSLGEKQLISFARTLIRDTKILVLDEATSSVDYKTDEFIQTTLKQFQCTILCIAHRLSTILNYDRVLVMDKGELMEVGRPKDLFDRGGIFYELCERGGVKEGDFSKEVSL